MVAITQKKLGLASNAKYALHYNSWLRFFVMLVLAIVTIFFGGVHSLSRFIFGIVISSLFFLWLFSEWRRCSSLSTKEFFHSRLLVLAPSIWLVLPLVLIIIQLCPLPPVVLSVISPVTSSLYDQADAARSIMLGIDAEDLEDLGFEHSTPTFRTLSLSPFRTIKGGFHYFFLILWFVLVTYLFRKAKRLSLVLNTITIFGVLLTVYGFYEYLSGAGNVLWEHRQGMRGVSGTFINPNHCAGYLSMCFFCSLGVVGNIILRLHLERLNHWRSRLTTLFSEKNASILFWFVPPIVILAGIFFTKSRSGISFTLIGILFFIIFYYLQRADWKIIAGFIFLTLLAVYWTGLTGVGERFDQLSEGLPQRFLYWLFTLIMMRDFPLFGMGMNTFERVFAQYQMTFISTAPRHSHNDYLEFFAEGGLVAIICIIVFFYFFVRVLIRSREHFSRIPVEYRPAFAGAASGIVVLLLHSLTDFNLHIPAVQLLFLLLLSVYFLFGEGKMLYSVRRKRSSRKMECLDSETNETIEINKEADLLTNKSETWEL